MCSCHTSVTVTRRGLPRPPPGSLTGPGGGKGNTWQTLLFTVTAIPAAGFIHSEQDALVGKPMALAPGSEGICPVSATYGLCDPREVTDGSEPRLPQMRRGHGAPP